MLYTGIIGIVLFDDKCAAYVENELARLRSEISSFKNVAEIQFPFHWSSDTPTSNFHLLHSVLDDLEGLGRFSFTNAAQFEHFNMLIKHCHRMTSHRFSTRIHETLQNMSSVLHNVLRPESRVHGDIAGAYVFRKWKCEVNGEGCLVGDGVCRSPQKVSEATERARAAVPLEQLLAEVFG